jgi:hypothetical protein
MHGMEPGWCYLCRVEDCGVDPQIVWGIALDEDLPELRFAPGPMTPDVAAYMRFLCEELALQFDPTFTQREAAMVLQSFLTDPATPDQVRTLEHLGEMEPIALTYGAARSKIRRLVALRGLRSA